MDNNELLFKIEVQGSDKAMQELSKLKGEMLLNGKAFTDLNNQLKAGKIGLEEYAKKAGELEKSKKNLTNSIKENNIAIDQQVKYFRAAEGSMDAMNQKLGALRTSYRALSEAERNSQTGINMQANIAKLDAELKKLDASIGNYQRNVGNYGMIAGQLGGIISQSVPGISQAVSAVQNLGQVTTGMTGAMKVGVGAIGVAVMAFGAYASAVKDGVQMLIKEEQTLSRLKFALDNNAEATGRMAGFAKEMAGTSLFKKSDILSAESLALSLGRTEEQTKKLVETAMGLSRATGVDLNTAVLQLSGTYEGTLGRLKRYNGALADLSKEQLAAGMGIDLLYDKFAKFGREGLDTVGGKLELAEKKINAYKKELAAGFIPVVAWAADKLKLFWDWVAGGNKANDGKSFMADYSDKQAELMRSATKDNQQGIIDRNQALADSYFKLWKAANDPNQRAQYAKNYTEQLDTVKALKAQMDDLNKASYKPGDKGGGTDPNKAYKDMLDKRIELILQNNEYISQLTRQAIDSEIMAMQEGKDKELAIEADKLNDTRNDILNKQAEIIAGIDVEIKAIESKGKRATLAELKQLEDLRNQKLQLILATNTAVENAAIASAKRRADIEKKFSGTDKDSAISSKYSADVAQVEADGQMKLDMLRTYYAAKGQLTAKELQDQKRDELKIMLEIAQKKYDLLYAEIQARKAVGAATQEQLDAEMAALSALYAEIKRLTSEAGGSSEGGGEKKKPGFGQSIIMDLFGVTEEQSNQILQQVGNIVNSIRNLWIQNQQDKIAIELKNEQKKLDKQYKNELTELEQARRRGLITEKQYNERKEKLDEEKAAKEDKLKREAFEKNKKIQLLNAIINTAIAVTAGLMTTPFMPLGILMGALAGVLGGIEIATIASQKYVGARGGMLQGASHNEGGIKYASGGNIIELEGGEAVLNKRSMSSSDYLTLSGTPRQIASGLNSYNGYGVRFEDGGMLASRYIPGGYDPVPTPRSSSVTIDRGSMNQAIDERLAVMKVYVVESEITDSQNRVKQIQVESAW